MTAADAGARVPGAASQDSGTLLVVDDEPTVRELLSATLRYAGFTVATAATGQEALAEISQQPPDLVVLDVMLPDIDGFEVLRRLRELPRMLEGHRGRTMPVLFLTALDTPRDTLNGLRLGGDDYVTKPFDLEILIARIHAILRRTSGDTGDLVVVGDLVLDCAQRQLTRGGEPVRLSPTEFRLLHFLMLNAGHVVSKAQILTNVWKYEFGGDTSIVDTYISYLRRKVDTTQPRLIRTIHGTGYVLRRPRQ
jgi:two-component system OmpR family response regulator